MKLTKKDKRNLFLGIITVAVLGLITLFVIATRADATIGWEHTDTEYGECVANDSEDCENYGGTRTVTKTYVKYGFVCPEGYHEVSILCEKNGPQTHFKSKVWGITDTKTEESTEECEVVPPVCEEPEKPKAPPSPYSDGRSSDPGATEAPKPPTCTLVLEKPTVWYENGKFMWATDQKDIEKFSIIYGETPDSLVYGIDNIPADSRGIEINRPAWNQTWFQVWSWVKGCPSLSDVIDP